MHRSGLVAALAALVLSSVPREAAAIVDLRLFSCAYTDDCPDGGPGDGDGNIDPGEDVSLVVTIRNFGGDPATNVAVTATTTTPGVGITQGSTLVGNLAGRTQAAGIPPLLFHVDLASYTCGTPITIDLAITSPEQNTTGVCVSTPLTCNPCGPDLQFASCSLNQDSCILGGLGNNNGEVDPGETAHLTVTIENNGNFTANNVSATFTSLTPGVNVTQPDATFADVPAGGSASGIPRITINVGGSVGCGEDIVLQGTITSDEGTFVETCTITIPMPCNPCTMAPFVTISSCTVATDTCAGGGAGHDNGIPEPGETVTVTVAAQNVGQAVALGVTGIAASATNGVVLTQTNLTFGNMDVNEEVVAPETVNFTVDLNDVACGQEIRIDVSLRSGATGWNSFCTISIPAPCAPCGAPPEICGSGADEDLDSLTDCEDPDCAAFPACIETLCQDGRDNDFDGFIDCLDPDCIGLPICVETNCADGRDNEGDGLIDCLDPDCAGPGCVETNCTDGRDNELDGLIDCQDPDCAGPACVETDCSDGRDNEFDGLTDCQDPDCAGPGCVETNCTDGRDNEFDGLTDCADPDCAGPACVETNCGDNRDNELDGLTDCDDPDCEGVPPCIETACDDTRDNDLDGLTDCQDPDCNGTPECFEGNCSNTLDDDGDTLADCNDPDCFGIPPCVEVICNDNFDNDRDNLIDCEDPDCASQPQCNEVGECLDNVDNDGDGFTDCADSDCASEPACNEVGECDDNIDNDGDGEADCLDVDDCATDPACIDEDCDDNIDNDGDGDVDCEDADCNADPACNEVGECADGQDNDGDTLTDCADVADCGPPVCGNENCTNNVDDDLDGDTDCEDSECILHATCLDDDFDGDTVPNGTDCAPVDPTVWDVPDAVQGLTIRPNAGGGVLISWNSLAVQAGPGTHYDVLRGLLSDLRADRDISAALCFDDDVTGTSTADTASPPAGDSFYYLVRGQNVCGDGIYGLDSRGQPRVPGAGDCP